MPASVFSTHPRLVFSSHGSPSPSPAHVLLIPATNRSWAASVPIRRSASSRRTWRPVDSSAASASRSFSPPCAASVAPPALPSRRPGETCAVGSSAPSSCQRTLQCRDESIYRLRPKLRRHLNAATNQSPDGDRFLPPRTKGENSSGANCPNHFPVFPTPSSERSGL